MHVADDARARWSRETTPYRDVRYGPVIHLLCPLIRHCYQRSHTNLFLYRCVSVDAGEKRNSQHTRPVTPHNNQANSPDRAPVAHRPEALTQVLTLWSTSRTQRPPRPRCATYSAAAAAWQCSRPSQTGALYTFTQHEDT